MRHIFDENFPAFAMHLIKFLRHHNFKTHAQRLGKVIKVRPSKLVYGELHVPRLKEVEW